MRRHPLETRIAALRGQARRHLAAYGLASLAVGTIAAVASAGMLDWLVHLTSEVRLVLLLAVVGLAGWLLVRRVVTPLVVRFDDLAIALRIEDRWPGLNDRLASTVQFLREAGGTALGSQALRDATVAQTIAETDQIDFRQAVDGRPASRKLAQSALAFLAVGLVVAFSPTTTRIALTRLFAPFGPTEWPRQTHLSIVEAETARKIARGEPYTLAVKVGEGERMPSSAKVTYVFADGETAEEPLRPADDGVFRGRLDLASRPFSFTVAAGDDQTAPWDVQVVPPPALTSLLVTLTPPAYTGMPPQTLAPGNTSARAVFGTRVDLKGVANKPLAEATLRVGEGRSKEPVTRDPAGLALAATFPAEATAPFWFELTDTEGFRSQEAVRYDLRTLADEAPKISFEEPTQDRDVPSKAVVPVRIVADDDFGLHSIRLVYTVSTGGSEPAREVILPLWDGQARKAGEPPSRHEAIAHRWDLAPLNLQPGAIVTYHADARDFDDVKGPNLGKTRQLRLRIVSDDEAARRLEDQQRALRDEVERTLAIQKQAQGPVDDARRTLARTPKLPANTRENLRNAETIQRQVTSRVTSKADGLEQRVGRILDDIANFKIPNADVERQMAAMKQSVERIKDSHLALAEQNLTKAGKGLDDRTPPASANKPTPADAATPADGPTPAPAGQPEPGGAPKADPAAASRPSSADPAGAPAGDQAKANPTGKPEAGDQAKPNPGAKPGDQAKPSRAGKPGDQAKSSPGGETKPGDDAKPNSGGNPEGGAESKPTPGGEAKPNAGDSKPGDQAKGNPGGKPQGGAGDQAKPNQPKPNDQSKPDAGDPKASPEIALNEAGKDQKAIADELKSMLDRLSEFDTFRGAVKDAKQLLGQQEQALKQSAEAAARPEVRGKSPEAMNPEAKADLENLGARQNELAKLQQNLESKFEEMAKKLEGTDPLAAAALREANKQARQRGTSAKMAEAGEQLGKNQMGQARQNQEQARNDLKEMLDTLQNRRERELARLVQELKQSEADLKGLRARQQANKEKTAAARNIADPKAREKELQKLAKEQAEIQKEMKRQLQKLAKLGADAAAQAGDVAAAKMAGAEGDLNQDQGEKAEGEMEEALQDLRKAQREVAQNRRDAEEQLAMEQIAKMADTLRSIAERQGKMVDETGGYEQARVKNAGKLTIAQRTGVRDLGRVQSGLKDEAGDLIERLGEGAPVFTLTLKRATAAMDDASGRLLALKTDDPTVVAEKTAHNRFKQLLDSLKPDKIKKADGDGDENAGNQGGAGGQGGDNIPAAAQIKMLRTLQQEINERTDEFDKLRERNKELNPAQKRELDLLQEDQGALADLVRDLTRPKQADGED